MSVLSTVGPAPNGVPSETATASGRARIARDAVVLVGTALATLVLALEAARYLGLGAYLDHIESNVAVSAWQYAEGMPLYGMKDGLPRLATYYGPLAYLAELPGLLLFGPSVAASKLLSLSALFATVALMSVHFLRRASPRQALHGLFFLAAGLLLFSPMSFWIRPDPVETSLVAAGVMFAASPLCVGLCIGFAVNLKAHAFVYFLPILIELWTRRGWRPLALLAFCAGGVFLLPFLAPGISLADYVRELAQQVGQRGQSSSQLLPVLTSGVVLALPLMLPLAANHQPRDARIYASATLGTLTLLFYPATFSGSGAYHFLPLVPVLAEARRRLRLEEIGLEFVPFLMLLYASVVTRQTLATMAERVGFPALADEALALAREAPAQTVQMGYGDNRRSYEISQLSKAELAFAGHPAVVDAQVLMELKALGIDGSRRWVADLDACGTARWLLPRGEEPFAVRSYFYDDSLVFGEAFRKAFLAHYRIIGESAHFAVWGCRNERQ